MNSRQLIALLGGGRNSYKLISFSISPIGLKLTYELNTDEKIRILALENIALQNEVKLIKSEISEVKFKTFGVLLILFVILAFEKIKPKKNSPTEVNPKIK